MNVGTATKQESNDLCKTCEHYWQDFPMPLDEIIDHCEIIDKKHGMYAAGRKHLMDELVPYPCSMCPFDSYKKEPTMTEIFYSVEGNILYPDKSMLTWGPFHYHDRSLAVERMGGILKDITDWCNLKDPSLHIEPTDLIRTRSNDQIVFRIKAWNDERTIQDCNGIIQVNTHSFYD